MNQKTFDKIINNIDVFGETIGLKTKKAGWKGIMVILGICGLLIFGTIQLIHAFYRGVKK